MNLNLSPGPWESAKLLVDWAERWYGIALAPATAQSILDNSRLCLTSSESSWYQHIKWVVLPFALPEGPPRPKANPNRRNYPIQSDAPVRTLKTLPVHQHWSEMSPGQETAYRRYEEARAY